MKLVYTAESLIDGRLVMDMLNHAGVPCLLFNENSMAGFGDLPATYPEVWAQRDGDLDKAKLCIVEFEQCELSNRHKTCNTCCERNPATFDICWQCHMPLPHEMSSTS